MSDDKSVRDHLLNLLVGRQAHVNLEPVLAGFPEELQGKRPEGINSWNTCELPNGIFWSSAGIPNMCPPSFREATGRRARNPLMKTPGDKVLLPSRRTSRRWRIW